MKKDEITKEYIGSKYNLDKYRDFIVEKKIFTIDISELKNCRSLDELIEKINEAILEARSLQNCERENSCLKKECERLQEDEEVEVSLSFGTYSEDDYCYFSEVNPAIFLTIKRSESDDEVIKRLLRKEKSKIRARERKKKKEAWERKFYEKLKKKFEKNG